MDSLLESIIKCMQIQNSLYRLVLLKLEKRAAEPEDENDVLPGPKASDEKSAGKNQDCDLGTLLCELKSPLEALMRSAEIQRGLFQRMVAVNSMITDEFADPPNDGASLREGQESRQVNILTVRSDLEEIAFKTKMPCYYARNPYTNQEVKAITSDDVLHHVCQDERPLSSRTVKVGTSGQRELPHGFGTLKTVTGKLLYKGDWCRGKRHGKGEGLILSVPLVGSSPGTIENGFYSGGWKNNMRHGKGKMTFVSGVVYEGQWQYDEMTGYGTLKCPDGTIQEGNWKDGSLDGCVLFTWPHGVAEYREYKQGQGQLPCSKIDKETAVKLTQMSPIRSQLLALRECAAELKDENLALKDELNTLRVGQAESDEKHEAAILELRQYFDGQRELDSEELRKEFEQRVKDAEESKSKSSERIRELEKELEEAKGGRLCQICFENPRDCIIMPCTHLLYCRTCVAEHKRKGDSRCPTCRGPISGEMLCNVNH